MEIIRRTVLRAMTTIIVKTTEGLEYKFIPDPTAMYHMKIGLTSEGATHFPYPYFYGYGYNEYGDEGFGIGEDLLLDDNYI
jgi:hypothetical protein